MQAGDAVTWPHVAPQGRGYRFTTRTGVIVAIDPGTPGSPAIPVALVRSRNGRRCLIPTGDLRREVDRILTERVDAMLAARLPCVRQRGYR